MALAMGATMVFAGSAAADQHEGLLPEGEWTDDQITALVDLIHETEAALPAQFPTTATYEQLDETLGGMGYFEFGVSAPGGYDHWINPGWVVDDHILDPQFPESLVYQLAADGTWHLVSAMFMLHPEIDMSSIPEEAAWVPGWHGHPELCINPDGRFGGITNPDDPNCPEGTVQGTTPLMMHVWIVDNACGHRFGGVGVQGLHCDVSHGGHDGNGDGHDGTGDGHDGTGDGHDGGQTPPPAPPVVADPNFTG